ncbi:interferon regulatory factor 3 isoform X3 [Erpetoichthys calabaricus]|uniref:Interferon regulatory factor 3 n=1 Tax=Erpetoichthys calabaricus TaxID=27687 RepID=A0A8C4SBJ0_ERPCA|nr:interferon regulatory factor 3 isoform X2 [Erpetoichthys calabaricus]XP_051789672.1 interferon regulatory factor 3 isoform X3 [Erpetoichthys calabaricus]
MSSQKPLLLPWLIKQIDSGLYPGLEWTNKDHSEFRIPWKHGLRQDLLPDDSLIFKAWAIASGRYKEKTDSPDPTVWKRNFRCALNRKTHFKVVKDLSNDSVDPHKVYHICQSEESRQSSQESCKDELQESPQDDFPGAGVACFPPASENLTLGHDFFSNDFKGYEGILEHNLEEMSISNHMLSETESLMLNNEKYTGTFQFGNSTTFLPSECHEAYNIPESATEAPDPGLQQTQEFRQEVDRTFINEQMVTDFRVSIYFRGVLVAQFPTVRGLGFQLLFDEMPNAPGTENFIRLQIPGTENISDTQQSRYTERILRKLGQGLAVKVQDKSILASRLGDSHIFWSLSKFDSSCHPQEVSKHEYTEVYNFGRFVRELHDFIESRGGSPQYSLWFCLGEVWPDPNKRPWEKKLIMIEVIPICFEILKNIAVAGGASSLQGENIELQLSDNPSLRSLLESMETN